MWEEEEEEASVDRHSISSNKQQLYYPSYKIQVNQAYTNKDRSSGNNKIPKGMPSEKLPCPIGQTKNTAAAPVIGAE